MLTILTYILLQPQFIRLDESFYGPKQASLIGSSILRYYIWDVYEANLYSENGYFTKDSPFILSLNYKLSLKGGDIAKQSIKEIKNQKCGEETSYTDWEIQLNRIFPDVKKGDQLAGFYQTDGKTKFFHNGTFIGSIKEKNFSSCFFDIWLGEKTSEPELRKSLLGFNNEKN